MQSISTDQLMMVITILVPMLASFWTILHKMDQKFDKVDQKFEKIDHELQDIKTRLTVLETVMGLISGGLQIQHPKERKERKENLKFLSNFYKFLSVIKYIDT